MKKILIIEDTVSLREQIEFTLRMEGYEVFTAENGREGVRLALQLKPDLILCDIVMPEMDGYDVILSLKGFDKLFSTPFIYITALSERKNFREGMELGADDYLVKPFSIDELIKAVTTQLNKSDNLEKRIKLQIDWLENDIQSRVAELKQEAEHQKIMINEISVAHDKILEELNEKQAQLMQEALRSIETNVLLQEMAKQLQEELLKNGLPDNYRNTLSNLRNRIRKRSVLLNNWTIFQMKFDLIYPEISTSLISKYPSLTSQDRLIISAIFTSLNNKQLSVILNVQPASIRKYKYRLKLKLGLDKNEDIVQFINKLSREVKNK